MADKPKLPPARRYGMSGPRPGPLQISRSAFEAFKRNPVGMVGGVAKAVVSGQADPETAAKRWEICQQCPMLRQGICQLCGCPMAAKVKFKNVTCPFKDEDGKPAPKWL